LSLSLNSLTIEQLIRVLAKIQPLKAFKNRYRISKTGAILLLDSAFSSNNRSNFLIRLVANLVALSVMKR
jgi:hypothetical protein